MKFSCESSNNYMRAPSQLSMALTPNSLFASMLSRKVWVGEGAKTDVFPGRS